MKRNSISALFLILIWISAVSAQAQNEVAASASAANPELTARPSADVAVSRDQIIPLNVPAGTAIQVVLDQDIRIRNLGQPVQGQVAEPVYAFDKLVIPQGSKVTGEITALRGVSDKKRVLDALNADFTPARDLQIEFTSFDLADGRHIPIHTTVTQGSGQVIQFVTSADADKKKTVKDVARDKTEQAKQDAKQRWDDAMTQVHEPGKVHKIERYAEGQLPVHPQYIDRGTVYFAELKEPLDFGTEPLSPETASSINTPPPTGSSVHARLMTELNSATTQKGDEVEAVLSEPLFDGNRLVLPQGCQLKGSVVQVQPARHFSHNGQLRMVFHDIVLPDGIELKIQASLEGVQSSAGQDVKLDSEGGAEATTPKTRYLQTGIAVALAFASSRTDTDGDSPGGHFNDRVAGGAGGFKLVGIGLGAFVHSQPFGLAMGAYGASMSLYGHFIARGREVVFPKNTAMEIGISPRSAASELPLSAPDASTK